MADMENVPHEVERKFVVRMPEEGWFEAQPGHVAKDIKQTYIDMGQEGELRVRQTTIGDDVSFVSTEKRGVGIDRVEIEKDLTEAEAAEMLEYADPTRRPVEKTRHVVPSGGHNFEIDVYPWDDKNCIMEVELGSADEEFDLPEGITVVGEVTFEPWFKNNALAALKDGPSGGLIGLYSATHVDFLPETLDDIKSVVQAKKENEERIHRGVFVDNPEAVKSVEEHLGAPEKDGLRYGTFTIPIPDRSDGSSFGPDTLEPFNVPGSYMREALKFDADRDRALREKLGIPERDDSELSERISAVDLHADSDQQEGEESDRPARTVKLTIPGPDGKDVVFELPSVDSGYMGHVYDNPFLAVPTETSSDGKPIDGSVTMPIPSSFGPDAHAMPARPYVGQRPKLDEDRVKAIREKLGVPEERVEQALKDSGYTDHVYDNPFLTPTLKETPSVPRSKGRSITSNNGGKAMIDVDFPTDEGQASDDLSK